MSRPPLLLLLIGFLLAGCGYTLERGNPPLPQQARTLALLPVRNETYEPILETETATVMQETLRSNTSVILLPEGQADLELLLSLVRLVETRTAATTDAPAGITVSLSAQASLKDFRKDRYLWKEVALQASLSESAVNDSLELVSGIKTTRIRQELLEQLCRKVYDRIFLDF
jgi:outer membrane lipopolysaccharide assembly protein LptE/RlpB